MEIENFNNNDLFIFEEDDIIKNNKHNSKWIDILNLYINDNILYIKDKKIICSGTILGTILGTYYGIMYYLGIFNRIVEKLNKECHKYCGLDQGIHNYLIYSGKLDTLKIRVLTNIDNYVNTLCLGYKGINDEYKITNINNEGSCIAHQYDRISNDMKEKISSKYNFVINK